jgi:hypothetical protein
VQALFMLLVLSSDSVVVASVWLKGKGSDGAVNSRAQNFRRILVI